MVGTPRATSKNFNEIMKNFVNSITKGTQATYEDIVDFLKPFDIATLLDNFREETMFDKETRKLKVLR